jgi:tRNA-specific adenosine deaminase 3
MYPATTREQFMEWKNIWPIVYRVQKPKHLTDTQVKYITQLSATTDTDKLMGYVLLNDKEIACEMDTRHKHPLHHTAMNLISTVSKLNTTSYLLNGCTVILSREPCVMCSMALLHSRIDRLVYVTRNTTENAGISMYKIGQNKKLNHTFDIFSLVINQ